MSAYPAPQSIQTVRQPQHLRPEPPAAPSLATLLAAFPHLPARTAVLGVGRDGLPVLFDLQDDRPGAILVCADHGAGKTSLLQTLLVSTLTFSLPHEAQAVVVAADRLPWEWLDQDLAANRYLLDIASAHEPAAASWILRLASMAQARQKGLQSGPTLLLLVDGVQFVAEANADVRAAFEWLCQNGPPVGIWPVAALEASLAGELDRLVSRFRTHIVGRPGSRAAARLFGLEGNPIAAALQSGFRFAVQVNDDWIVFDLPAVEERQTWR